MYGIAFPKDDPQFGGALKSALAAIMTEGTYDQVLRKWSLTEDSSIRQPIIDGQP
ncbi:ABC-type amino acid transport substrate-binding protein [Bradyrhizobium sp. USDA 4341]